MHMHTQSVKRHKHPHFSWIQADTQSAESPNQCFSLPSLLNKESHSVFALVASLLCAIGESMSLSVYVFDYPSVFPIFLFFLSL